MHSQEVRYYVRIIISHSESAPCPEKAIVEVLVAKKETRGMTYYQVCFVGRCSKCRVHAHTINWNDVTCRYYGLVSLIFVHHGNQSLHYHL